MDNTAIQYPTKAFKGYIEYIYKYCKENDFSLILKGSLASGAAKKNSDIDVIVLGPATNDDIDHMISGYGAPVMTNYTENPKGIFILVYQNGICVDLDLRECVIKEDLESAIILNKNKNNFFIGGNIVRKTDVASKLLPERPEWYKLLRLMHRGIIKFLCGKEYAASELLAEIKESLDSIGISNAGYDGDFKDDMVKIFTCIDHKYNVGCAIRRMFESLFRKL